MNGFVLLGKACTQFSSRNCSGFFPIHVMISIGKKGYILKNKSKLEMMYANIPRR